MAKPDLSEFLEKPKRICISNQLIQRLDKEDREKVEAALLLCALFRSAALTPSTPPF